MNSIDRRRFLRRISLGMTAPFLTTPFLRGLPSAWGAPRAGVSENQPTPKRLIIMFSPNGTVPKLFWPDKPGKMERIKPILKPLEPFQSRLLMLKGISNQVLGDGDSHMRGMSCLLTGTELFPGNVQGGSATPAGWSKGISIDQKLKELLQSQEKTRTRFGSLEFGVAVPNRADPWTRMSYAGPNKPVAPIDDPQQMLDKIYGKSKDKKSLVSILDGVKKDLKQVSKNLSREDRRLLEEHMNLVSEMEKKIALEKKDAKHNHPVPEIDPTIELVNDNTPKISRIQIDLLVNSFVNDMARVGTLQYMRSVGQARMSWLGIKDGHHGLSHEPDGNKSARKKLKKINSWFAGELAYLTKKLAETPEPNGKGGYLLDNTLVVWVNELGKGNSHTLDDIPFVLIGGENLGIKTGRSLEYDDIPHNRLLLAIFKAMGHEQKTFGTQKLCSDGSLNLV